MRHSVINTGSYLLVVSDEEIKANDKYLTSDNRVVNWHQEFEDNIKENRPKPIKAHLPLNNSPILQGVDLLPPLEQEDDVEKLADFNSKNHYKDQSDYWAIGLDSFKRGYNKAKEKYKYTEEQMFNEIVNAFNKGIEAKTNIPNGLLTIKDSFDYADKTIQSLSQPKLPVAFECETEKVFGVESPDFSEQPKTITNQQGIQWVGKWIY